MKIKNLTFLLLLSGFVTVQAQSVNAKKTLKKAQKALYNEKYDEAQSLYKSLVTLEPNNDRYNFEAGLSYLFSTFEREKSIPYFETALQNSTKDTIPELLYYLAKSYQLVSDFEKSNQTFNQFDGFIDLPKKSGKILKSDVLKEVDYNKNGTKYLTEKNDKITLENIGEGVNTKDREYATVFHQSNDVVVFTSRRKYKGNKLDKGDLLPYEDIYVAKKIDNKWTLVSDKSEINKYLPENVNTKKHDASICYSIDGKIVYTYKKDAVWQSINKDGKWGTLERLDKNINSSKFNVPSVTITPDGNTLFFVSTKKDGVGGKDIYKSSKNSSGNWDIPALLSSNINTTEDEDAPFLTQDGKTLYFSSRGHSSIGGYDIFKSELVNGEWGLPVNLGIPYNSPLDDIFFVTDEKAENGYISTDRIGGKGSFDIYSFTTKCKNIENTEIRGIVYDSQLKKPVASTITITNKKDNKSETVQGLASNGKFLIIAQPESEYVLSINAEGYSTHNVSISIPEQCDYFQLFTEISLERVKINEKDRQVATIRNSFFNREQVAANASTTDTSFVPDFKDENDANYDNDIAFIKKTRTFDEKNQPNHHVIKDTVDATILADNTSNNNQSKEFAPVYFDFDKSNLSKTAKTDLDKLILHLKSTEGKEYLLDITGHSDGKRDIEISKKVLAKKKIKFSNEAAEQRSISYNLELSEFRANQVAKYLKQKGISNQQLIINFVGESQPAAPNLNSDGSNNLDNQKLNRRVTFKLIKQKVI